MTEVIVRKALRANIAAASNIGIPDLGFPITWRGENAGIYRITHLRSGKVYIGSSMRFYKRLMQHRSDLRRGANRNIHLQRAYDRHGEDEFRFELIAACRPEDRVFYEQRAINSYRAADPEFGYNICRFADSNKGFRHTPQSKAAISRVHKGKKLSPEHRERIGVRLRGRPKSAEHRAKIGAGNKGKTVSEDLKRRLSIAHTGISSPGSGAIARAKTHCPQGHEYTPENTLLRPTMGGKYLSRNCRACRRIRAAEKRERLRGGACHA